MVYLTIIAQRNVKMILTGTGFEKDINSGSL